jgi:hypothetical protein
MGCEGIVGSVRCGVEVNNYYGVGDDNFNTERHLACEEEAAVIF